MSTTPPLPVITLQDIARLVLEEGPIIADEFGVCHWPARCRYGTPIPRKRHRWKLKDEHGNPVTMRAPWVQDWHDPTCPNVLLGMLAGYTLEQVDGVSLREKARLARARAASEQTVS